MSSTASPSLQTLVLENNKLSSVDAGVFSGLPLLFALRMKGNEFTTLPDGMFTSIGKALSTFDASVQFNDNPDSGGTDITEATAKIALKLTQVGSTLTLDVPSGAPYDMTVNLSVSSNLNSTLTPTTISLGYGHNPQHPRPDADDGRNPDRRIRQHTGHQSRQYQCGL